ncbi:MAG: thiamine phosphate synthase [Planctomycetes bacterium]|nr:thiamine phosphate synthase [Planctomycetota bacterium]
MSLDSLHLYLLFTPQACPRDPFATLAAALEAGVDLVQWRSKDPDRPGFERARALCQRASVPFVVNDDVMLAVRSRAAGAHVGQEDMPADAARKLLGQGWLGVSTHDREQLAAAVAAGADYLGFGPCFPTATKGYAAGKAPTEIAAAVAAAAQARVPLFAIGGITAANLSALRALGVERIAVSSAVLAADDPAAAVRELRRLLPAPR